MKKAKPMKKNNLMKKLFVLSIALTLFCTGNTFAMDIRKTSGNLECAYVEWQTVSGATRYNVYYEQTGGEKTKIDDKLIRRYPDYMRADALGLKAGVYRLTIEALDESGKTIDSATTDCLDVKANVREGFAFTDGNVPGAYKMDGTPKDGARILYVTENDINKITCEVKDKKGKATTYTGLGDILTAYSKGYDKTPLIIRVVGTITDTGYAGIKDGNYLNLAGFNNKDRSLENVTIEGVGNDATLYGFGITLKRTKNMEIKNLGIMLFGDDAVSLDTDNKHIWIHNTDFFYGKPGKDADQVKGDGSIDIKYRSTDITISFNHFFDSGKVMGCGGATGEDENLRITYHHNWFDHTDSRCPRLHFVTAHIYNNYYDGVSVYGIGNTSRSAAFVERNYFREVKRPMMISGQGTDKYDEKTGTYTLKGTFSGQDGGMTKAFDNIFVNKNTRLKLVYQTDNATQFDAYKVESREEKVPEDVKSVTGGCAYSNFDTAADMYESQPDAAADVPETVCMYAGRTEGGDLKWTFNNDTDDEDHNVNAELKTAIVNYKPQLIGYQDSPTTSINATAIEGTGIQKYYDLTGRKILPNNKGIIIVDNNKRRYKILK